MPKYIIGVDEVGCGALAGPLVVCAAAFLQGQGIVTGVYHTLRGDRLLTVGDSKSFRIGAHLECLAQAVKEDAVATCVLERTNQEIDARLLSVVLPETIALAIARIVENIRRKDANVVPEDFSVLVDGDLRLPAGIPCPCKTIAGGDKTVWQIGAASIVAKVVRDGRMVQLHDKYPKYGFDTNKGYPVASHKRLLSKHGPSPAHRRTFRPVAELYGLPEGFEV